MIAKPDNNKYFNGNNFLQYMVISMYTFLIRLRLGMQVPNKVLFIMVTSSNFDSAKNLQSKELKSFALGLLDIRTNKKNYLTSNNIIFQSMSSKFIKIKSTTLFSSII